MRGSWPGGHSFALALTFDFDAEEVWLDLDPENAHRPGVLSQGAYGAKVGVPLVLDVLSRHETVATFFVPGRVAERYPEAVQAIMDRGHEIGHHGYTHTSPTKLTPDEEELELVKGLDVLRGFGAHVEGYRSPAWEFSARTLQLIELHGLLYSSNMMDDIHPYRHPNSTVLELPVHWMLDDAAHWWFSVAQWTKKISTVGEVRTIWQEELLGIRSLGGLCVLTMHPQVVGRPSRIRFLDEFIGYVKGLGDAWIAPCRDIARHARQNDV